MVFLAALPRVGARVGARAAARTCFSTVHGEEAVVDLRSDTVTKPSAAMRDFIANCEVDDDVIDVDPTVGALQELIAELTGKEAAVFMPSGTMTNQIGLRVHCRPGDEFICESGCHIYNYEQGAYASLSGLSPSLITGNNGILEPDQLLGTIKADNEHLASLVHR